LDSDLDLIHRVVDGDGKAADLFVLRFSRFVWAILVRSFGLRGAEAEEIYQAVFVRLWEDDYRRLRLWSGHGDFASYLAPIVRHLALDALRVQGRRRQLDGPEEESGREPRETEPGPEELAIRQEQRRVLERAVEGLGPRDRKLYRLRFQREQSYKAIGQEMGMTVNHVGVALKRLEVRLMRRMRAANRSSKLRQAKMADSRIVW
jgi:RNA polymerase sigma factor (sigma-70 family)